MSSVPSRVHRARWTNNSGLTWTKAITEAIRRVALTRLGDLRVEPDRESRIGVTESFLRGLHVDSLLDESGRVRPAEVVKLKSRSLDGERRGDPHTVVPVAVVEPFTVAVHKEQLLGIKAARAGSLRPYAAPVKPQYAGSLHFEDGSHPFEHRTPLRFMTSLTRRWTSTR